MNIRHFSMALLISSLPLCASAAGISLEKGDFLSAERAARGEGTIVSVKLSKSGKAKLRKIQQLAHGEKVHSEIGGVANDFRVRGPIRGEGLEMGPYSEREAEAVVRAINRK